MKGKYWFKRKKYGWGWVPSSWEGWSVTILFAFFMLLIGIILPSHVSFTHIIAAFAVPLLLLTSICFMTGEPPKWQWGEK